MSPTPPLPPKTPDEIARDRIRSWIRTTHVTQTDLADRIGRNQAWLSRYLKGEFDADLSTLQQIARAFGHELTALLDLPRDPLEQRVIEAYQGLPIKARASLLDLLVQMQAARTRKARARKR